MGGTLGDFRIEEKRHEGATYIGYKSRHAFRVEVKRFSFITWHQSGSDDYEQGYVNREPVEFVCSFELLLTDKQGRGIGIARNGVNGVWIASSSDGHGSDF